MRLVGGTGTLVLAAMIAVAGAAAGSPEPKAVPPRAAPPKAKTAEPGTEHKVLSGLVGQWKSTIHVLSSGRGTLAPVAAPAQGAKDAQGTAEGKLELGGHFAQWSQSSVLNGQPYDSIAFWGFDNVIKKYTAIWMDSNSPAFLSYVGTYDAAAKALTLTSRYSDQTSRKYTASRIVLTFVDADTMVLDEYVAQPVGATEVHVKTITYKRG